MKNTTLTALLLAFTVGISTPVTAKQAPAQVITQARSTANPISSCSQSYCCDDESTSSSCDATTGASCFWLANAWCSAKNWVMNLFGKTACAAPKEDREMIVETEQDPEAENIPFQK